MQTFLLHFFTLFATLLVTFSITLYVNMLQTAACMLNNVNCLFPAYASGENEKFLPKLEH